MSFLSTKLIDELEKDTGIKFTLCSRRKMQKSIRELLITVHRNAIQETLIAKNKPQYIDPNFHDK